MGAYEPRLVPVHEPRGRTHAEERAARHRDPPRSPLALLRLRMPWQPGTFEEELAPLARALDVITAGERMGI